MFVIQVTEDGFVEFMDNEPMRKSNLGPTKLLSFVKTWLYGIHPIISWVLFFFGISEPKAKKKTKGFLGRSKAA